MKKDEFFVGGNSFMIPKNGTVRDESPRFIYNRYKNWNFELKNSDVTSNNDSRQNSDVAEKSLVPTPEDQTRFLQSLKETRREYLAIFDSIPAMIWYRDRTGRILKVNQTAADSVGLSIRQLVGKNYYDLFPEDAEQGRREDIEVMDSGRPLRGKLLSFTPFNGLKQWVSVDRIPLRNENGYITGVIVFALNITNQKQAEELLVEAKLEIEQANRQLKTAAEQAHLLAEMAIRSNQAKSELLASSSHDLRTPMNSILGFSEILLETPLDEEQKDYVNTIYQSAKGLLALLNDILEYSKIEAGKLKIEVLSCDPSVVLREIRAMMETEAIKKGLAFIVRIDEHLPTTFFTDPHRLRQCLINLVGNAIKFTDHGHIGIYISREYRAGWPCIRFDVEDTGIGISQDKQDVIFRPFSQADVSTAHKYGGTGLGLTITKRLAGLLGGDIRLESQLGKGSTFSIILPLVVQKEPEQGSLNIRTRPAQRSIERVCKRTGHILLAESMFPSQLMLMLMLRRAGLEVRLAGTIEQVRQSLKEQVFDLIFMDAAMGFEDPLTLLSDCCPQTPPPPIIFIDDLDNCKAQSCHQAGFPECLYRPLSRSQLYDVIARYLPEQASGKVYAAADTAPKDDIASIEAILNRLPELVEGMREVLNESDRELLSRFAELFSEIGQAADQEALHKKAAEILDCTQQRPNATQELAVLVDQLCLVCEQIHPAKTFE